MGGGCLRKTPNTINAAFHASLYMRVVHLWRVSIAYAGSRRSGVPCALHQGWCGIVPSPPSFPWALNSLPGEKVSWKKRIQLCLSGLGPVTALLFYIPESSFGVDVKKQNQKLISHPESVNTAQSGRSLFFLPFCKPGKSFFLQFDMSQVSG